LIKGTVAAPVFPAIGLPCGLAVERQPQISELLIRILPGRHALSIADREEQIAPSGEKRFGRRIVLRVFAVWRHSTSNPSRLALLSAMVNRARASARLDPPSPGSGR